MQLKQLFGVFFKICFCFKLSILKYLLISIKEEDMY